MSDIKVLFDNNKLYISQIRSRQNVHDKLEINVEQLVFDRIYKSDLEVKSKKNRNKILFKEKYQNGYLTVWSKGIILCYGYIPLEKAYANLFVFKNLVLRISLSKKYLSLWCLGYFIKLDSSLNVDRIKFYIDDKNYIETKMTVSSNGLSPLKLCRPKNLHHFKLPLNGLFNDETKINNLVTIALEIDGINVIFRIKKINRFRFNIREYYAPYDSVYTKGHAVHLRRTERGNFSIVKRQMEEIEKSLLFRFKESKLISFVLYKYGRFRSKHGKKKINLFYEKFSSKAEEGTFELFELCKQSKRSESYYIIDKDSIDYQRIRDTKGVVEKYSWKYYKLLYSVNSYISTEAPAHLNILRSNNKYFRLSTCEHPFVFLQHGVTYLKQQGPTSTFVAGKEGEPKYMVVGSDKERDVCADMLKLPEESFLNTGLPIFSQIEYNHINQDSEDNVVIMLTWKNYEEQIESFEQSNYYKCIIDILGILERYIARENIVIVPHPKMLEHCQGTSLESVIWNRPISEALNIAKLLITDYSSACYNCFYQGAAVVFYQEDIEKYEEEVGKLIPNDDEYIGERVFSMEALEDYFKRVINRGRVLLEKGRNSDYEERYRLINSFNDGKNIERIYEELVKMELV